MVQKTALGSIKRGESLIKGIEKSTGQKKRISPLLAIWTPEHLREMANEFISEANKLLETNYPEWNKVGPEDLCGELEIIVGHLKGWIVDEENIDRTVEQLKEIKNRINFLESGQGSYCALVGDICKISPSPKEQCFVIFDYNLEGFEDVIVDVLKKNGLSPLIAKHKDEEGSVGLLCKKICQEIRSSKICIADVTIPNINVGLEVGIAWRFNVPVFITFDKKQIDRPPSDLAAFTYIDYKDPGELKKKLSNKVGVLSEEGKSQQKETV